MERKQNYWGGLAAGYFFMAALGAMMFLVIAVLDLAGVKIVTQTNGWISLAALVATGIGALLLMVELGNKLKFYLVLTRPAAVMSLGAIIMSLFMVIAFIYATFFFSFIPWAGLIGLRKFLAVIGILAALGLVAYPGVELGEARGRAFWNGSALVPLFLITGAVSGLAGTLLMLTLLGYSQNSASLIINVVLFGLLIIQLLTVSTYIISMKNGGIEEAVRTVESILHGSFRSSFWGGIIWGGTIIPLLLYLAGSSITILVLKTVLVLIGGACFRSVFLQAAVRKSLPGEENDWNDEKETARLALELEQRWQQKAEWLYGQQ